MIPRGILAVHTKNPIIQALSRRCLTRTSQGPRPEKKHYRLWAVPGDLVYEKDILVRQFTMKWHPGLNVGINQSPTIYALRDGVMIITEEPYNPDWDSPLVREVYMKGEEKRAPPYARYIHVIPKKRISEFKLVDEI